MCVCVYMHVCGVNVCVCVPPLCRTGSMGVTLDLTPSGLVQFANERGLGPGADWQAYTQHHKQVCACKGYARMHGSLCIPYV